MRTEIVVAKPQSNDEGTCFNPDDIGGIPVSGGAPQATPDFGEYAQYTNLINGKSHS